MLPEKNIAPVALAGDDKVNILTVLECYSCVNMCEIIFLLILNINFCNDFLIEHAISPGIRVKRMH